MKKNTPSSVERFLALSDAEKDAEVAEFDKGIDPSQWRPLNPSQRKLWRRIKRKIGRPKVGQGAKRVAVTIEGGLLKRADQFAREHEMKRAEMVARGLELVMSAR